MKKTLEATAKGALGVPPLPAEDHEKWLHSNDPQLAANKRLVYDMYREVLEAGQVDRIPHYFTEDYIQHNPNVASGRDKLAEYIAGSRPRREAPERLNLPMIAMIAEGDRVVLNFLRIERDDEGGVFFTTWYDMFRIENGKLAEHWDPALLSPEALSFDPNQNRLD
ncbi:MAG: nuclear transport factor 2 family protein [Spongiibacteraceae bacterium]|jgi:predicted SnoaL-like aldol condensation-catalyzing enzyme|nr:nuclear transport factor 2 family protein [Spongiibacteraceae bacterium]